MLSGFLTLFYPSNHACIYKLMLFFSFQGEMKWLICNWQTETFHHFRSLCNSVTVQTIFWLDVYALSTKKDKGEDFSVLRNQKFRFILYSNVSPFFGRSTTQSSKVLEVKERPASLLESTHSWLLAMNHMSMSSTLGQTVLESPI